MHTAQPIPLESPSLLPAFDVKLIDAKDNVCPMRAYKSVTISCSEPGAFDIEHASSGSETHEMALRNATSDSAGPLQYNEVRSIEKCLFNGWLCWKGACLWTTDGCEEISRREFSIAALSTSSVVASWLWSNRVVNNRSLAGCASARTLAAVLPDGIVHISALVVYLYMQAVVVFLRRYTAVVEGCRMYAFGLR